MSAPVALCTLFAEAMLANTATQFGLASAAALGNGCLLHQPSMLLCMVHAVQCIMWRVLPTHTLKVCLPGLACACVYSMVALGLACTCLLHWIICALAVLMALLPGHAAAAWVIRPL